jgi:hypothetical protein
LNKQTLEARVKGKISDEDFATMKDAVAAEVAGIERGLKRLEDERSGMRELIKNTALRLSETLRRGGREQIYKTALGFNFPGGRMVRLGVQKERF